MAGTYLIGNVEDRLRDLSTNSIDVVMTSPPYWNGQRRYLPRGHDLEELEIGHEKNPEEYVRRLVGIFSLVREAMTPWGALWLNIGDAYVGGGSGPATPGSKQATVRGGWENPNPGVPSGYKALDLVGVPWMLATALRDDGWYLRSSTVWAKGKSLDPSYSGSVMPESVAGWRWERHKIKVSKGERYRSEARTLEKNGSDHSHGETLHDSAAGAKWVECEGCAICDPNDGLVLRKGSWRPTRAHEYLFLLTVTENYFFDGVEVLEPAVGRDRVRHDRFGGKKHNAATTKHSDGSVFFGSETRNMRDVLEIVPKGTSEKHYATFPVELVRAVIKGAVGKHGRCPECGMPFAPIVDVDRPLPSGGEYEGKNRGTDEQSSARRMLANTKARRVAGGAHGNPNPTQRVDGYRATCEHKPDVTSGRPVVVLDPFAGSGTVPLVADALGADWVAIDIDERNREICERRMGSLIFREEPGQTGSAENLELPL